MAGRVPSRAASSASRSRPAASAGGSRTACRGREVTVVRLIRADQALAGSQREDDRVVDGQLSALLPAARAFAIPMRTRFRGITVREGALIEGPAGWGEFSPFAEYGPPGGGRRLVRGAGAADIVVLKVQPLGGVRAALRVAAVCGLPVVVSSAVESSVGLAAGVALAAALPELPYDCGLATMSLLTGDVTGDPVASADGTLPVRASVVPDP